MPWTTKHAGHNSWLGWKGKEVTRRIPESCPDAIQENSSLYSTALDMLNFQSMLTARGVTPSGERILSDESAMLMTTDQLSEMGVALADAEFNSHSRDRKNSSGMKSPVFGVDAEGQGVGFGTQVVTRAASAKIAGSKGAFSSWGYHEDILKVFLELIEVASRDL